MRPEVYHQYARIMQDHWWSRARRLRAADLLACEGVFPDGSRRVLEIGSGVGSDHEFLAGYGSVTGVELDPTAIQYASKHAYTRLLEQDLNTFEPEPASFDLLVSLNVLYHAWVVDPPRVLARLAAGLGPGGLAVVTEPAFEGFRREHDEAVMTGRRWSRRGLRELLEGAGLEVRRLGGYGALLFPALLASVAVERLRGKLGSRRHHDVEELKPLPRPVEWTLDRVNGAERMLSRRLDFPFGPTWIALARKR